MTGGLLDRWRYNVSDNWTELTNVHIPEDNSSISIKTEHKDIEIHIKKWVTNSKGAPTSLIAEFRYRLIKMSPIYNSTSITTRGQHYIPCLTIITSRGHYYSTLRTFNYQWVVSILIYLPFAITLHFLTMLNFVHGH